MDSDNKLEQAIALLTSIGHTTRHSDNSLALGTGDESSRGSRTEPPSHLECWCIFSDQCNVVCYIMIFHHSVVHYESNAVLMSLEYMLCLQGHDKEVHHLAIEQ